MSGRATFLAVALLAVACGSGSGEEPQPAAASTTTPSITTTSVPLPPSSSVPTAVTSTTQAPLGPEMDTEVLFEVDGYAFGGSPAICDLEDDGSSDALLVMREEDGLPSQIRAVDLESGETRWATTDPSNNFYAQPLCHDLDGDGVLDVISAGWNSDVVALSGVDGSELWTLTNRNPDGVAGFPGYAGTSLRVDDHFLVTTTGNRNEELPGSIVAYDRTGAVLGSWLEPTGAEIYASLAGHPVGDGRWHLAVGSGGETLGGFLRILEWDPTSASFRELASAPSGCDTGGFNSSAVLVDADADGRLDAVGTDFCGRTTMLSGAGGVLWELDHDLLYSTANPALSDLDGDGTPEVIVTFSNRYLEPTETFEGEPATTISAHRIGDGEPVWEQRIARLSFASPVTFDATGDGLADVAVLTARARQTIPETDPEYSPAAGIVMLAGTDGEIVGQVAMGDAAGTPILYPLGSDTGLVVSDARRPGGPAVVAVRLNGVAFDDVRAWHGFRPGDDHGATWTTPEP